jgi:hypothetical protein
MWGGSGSNIGYKVPATQNKNNIPKRLEEFNGNVVKVSAGVNHTAVVTSIFHSSRVNAKIPENYSLSDLEIMECLVTVMRNQPLFLRKLSSSKRINSKLLMLPAVKTTLLL